jgi:hypothetical protein
MKSPNSSTLQKFISVSKILEPYGQNTYKRGSLVSHIPGSGSREDKLALAMSLP